MPSARCAAALRAVGPIVALCVSLLALAGTPAHAGTRMQDVCGSAAPGLARCDAQVLVRHGAVAIVRVHRARAFDATHRRLHSRAVISGAATEPAPGSPLYIQQAYDLTALSAGGGQGRTVAVVDAFGDPTLSADLAAFRANFGLPPCTLASACLRVLNEQGQSTPLPTASPSWSVEQALDVDAVSALCPNCDIVVVEADGADTFDMQQAVSAAVASGATIVSNSWSIEAPSSPFGSALSFPGVALIAASGDDGSMPAGESAYPAALPDVTAVGATELQSATGTPRGFAETAWTYGGSGCDTSEQAPAWQAGSGCTGRAYSDISADGAPGTGLDVYDNGGWLTVGGTSLSTPLVAAYEALTGVDGTTAQWAYQDESLLNDVVSGSNGGCPSGLTLICNAEPGWDGPTGAGSISGEIVPGAPGIGAPDATLDGSTLGYATSVDATGATLAGGIYPNGETTTYRWQYGTTSAYGAESAPATIAAGSSIASVQGALTGLAPGTTYHYRLIASNASGTSYGYDATLSTDPGSSAAGTGLGTIGGIMPPRPTGARSHSGRPHRPHDPDLRAGAGHHTRRHAGKHRDRTLKGGRRSTRGHGPGGHAHRLRSAHHHRI